MMDLLVDRKNFQVVLPTVLVSAALVLAPLMYVALANNRKLTGQQALTSSTKQDVVSGAPLTDYPQFDTSNLRVTKLFIHPIKSCKGTSVQETTYTLEGLEHDRKWCIIRADNHVVVTARQVGKIMLVYPRIIRDPGNPEGGLLEVTFPEESGCETFSLPLNPSQDTFETWKSIDVELWGNKNIQGYICETKAGRSPSAIMSAYVGFPVHMVVKGPRVRNCPPTIRFPNLDAPSRFQDVFPLLLLSEESVGGIQERIRDMVGMQGVGDKWAKEDLRVERFRPNIVFKGAGAPFLEDVVTELCVSSDKEGEDKAGIIHLVSKCNRCLLPNIDPATGVRDEAVPYKVIMKFRRGLDPAKMSLPCVGCNGMVTEEGVIRVGDWVRVRKMGNV